MIYPKLKFQLYIELDNEMAFQFMDMIAGGVDFGREKIIDIYPELAKAKEVVDIERRVVIADFTKKYYSDHKVELENKLKKIESEWGVSSKDYFSAVDSIFDGIVWPDGKYICYLSIFDCNPRFLDDKTFQVYQGLSDRTNYIIAHEMLHFMFFNYLDLHESDFKNSQDEHTIWLLSEWFNDLMLNLPAFKQFGENVESFYPEVAEFSKKFKDKSKIKDVKSFFEVIKPVISA